MRKRLPPPEGFDPNQKITVGGKPIHKRDRFHAWCQHK